MIPNFFSKKELPDKLPLELDRIIGSLRKSRSKEACLKSAYDILTKKYYGSRIMTYTRFFDLFSWNDDKLWKKSGFLHCTNINYLMRILLVKSGFFKDDDIKLKLTLLWYISPHQYLNIRINGKKSINVDVWGKRYGIKFGEYAHGFS